MLGGEQQHYVGARVAELRQVPEGAAGGGQRSTDNRRQPRYPAKGLDSGA
jgi:hypothetical protein